MKQVLGASDPSVAGATLAYAKGAGDLAFVREGQNETGLPAPTPRSRTSTSRSSTAQPSASSSAPASRTSTPSTRRAWTRSPSRTTGSSIARGSRAATSSRRARSTTSGETGEPKDVGAAGQPDQVSAPSLDGNTLVYAIATPRSSRIIKASLKKLKREVVIRSDVIQLFNPSVRGSSLLYVRGTKQDWELRLKKLGNRDSGRLLKSSDRRLWSTALSTERAYYTVLKGSAPTADIKSVQR